MAKNEEKKKVGAPSIYTELLADNICEEIATSSKSMKTICGELGVKVATVLNWLCEGHANYREDFSKKYARAKEMQADFLAEEIMEIADDGSNDYMTITKGDMEYNVEDREVTNRSRLRVDARKWYAGKLKPKKYGDKIDMEHTGPNGKPLQAPVTFISAEALTQDQIDKFLNDRAGN